jgi:hypothetical protein
MEYIYERINNYINIINTRYTTLINGINTKELNADNILYIGNGYSIANGLVTCRNTTPYLGMTSSLYVEGGGNIKKNIKIEALVTNNNNFEIDKLKNEGDINVEGNSKFGNIIMNSMRLKDMELKENIEVNQIKGNIKYEFKTNNGNFKIEEGIIEKGEIIMKNNKYGEIENIKGNIYKFNNFYGNNMNGKELNINNFKVEIYITKDIVIKNGNINNLLICNNLTSYKNAEITDTITIKRQQHQETTINESIYCDNIYAETIVTEKINTAIYRHKKYESIPIHRNNDIRFQVTTCNISFEYADSYTFILTENIIFNNPFLFKTLTIFFEEYVDTEYDIKPNTGLIFYVYGIRSDLINIYSVLYKVDYFETEKNKINITIANDQNNEINFISGFLYYIYKFNYNYYI